jgi:hypothetical protein
VVVLLPGAEVMSEETSQSCPICQAEVTPSPRYPHYLCGHCARRAADEVGRPLLFSNESFSGGFIAQYVDTGEARDSHVCFVDGVECWADEDYYGGIVIQPKKDSGARRA